MAKRTCATNGSHAFELGQGCTIDPVVSKMIQQVASTKLGKVHNAVGPLQGNTLNIKCIASTCTLMECTLMEHVVGHAKVPLWDMLGCHDIVTCQHIVEAEKPGRFNHM